jgi:hypothetical protein
MVENKIMNTNETKSTEQEQQRRAIVRGLIAVGHAATVTGGDRAIRKLDPEQNSGLTCGQFDAAVKEKFKHVIPHLIVAALKMTQDGNPSFASAFFISACESIGEQSMEELLAAEQKLNELKG